MNSILYPKFKLVEHVKPTISRSSIESDENRVKFRIVSYNILAQVFIKPSYFPHSPPSCLEWQPRSQKILDLLEHLQSDFLCLQEVDEYDNFYKQTLKLHGYSSIYIPRSGQITRDGCAIFYKNHSAELVLEDTIEYNDLAAVQDVNSSMRLRKDCVGIMGAFKLKNDSSSSVHHLVIVANTHLYWDPKLADVKLAQAKYLLSRLSEFKDSVSDIFGCKPSVVVCGDFNSTPTSEVYQYLVSGVSSPLDKCPEGVPISLSSVYALTGGEPPFTNCTPDFTDTLDYIFFSSSGQLKPVTVLELPGPESSDVVGGLPNFVHPSDHLPLGADFELR